MREPVWKRHRAMTAAVGLQSPERIFCRETALVLYGVPLIAVPRAVHIRAMGTSEVGTRPLCGNLQTQAIQRRMPLRALAPPVPRGDAAEDVRHSYWRAVRGNTDTVEVPGITYDNGTPARVKVEPLAMALIDTVPRMGKQEAVVALDAVFAAGADSRGSMVGSSSPKPLGYPGHEPAKSTGTRYGRKKPCAIPDVGWRAGGGMIWPTRAGWR